MIDPEQVKDRHQMNETPEYAIYYNAYMLVHNTFKNNSASKRLCIQRITEALKQTQENE